ncbi:vancomycin resistance protein VanJ [Crossiella equi]|uniref:Vancomycin resistance protein VanJ n=1 Tax=Crossiella equi TaxID=130796 RepID=A0ABS5APW8_9PSEU|nr:endonuclease/exonuclease/phosphatase family protein [Crossiella equi]MBP2478612.1 vancomycin resistance protein VanJ [Crossiella equi]
MRTAVLTGLALLVAVFLGLPWLWPGGPASQLPAAFLPWAGIAVALLLVVALAVRAWAGAVATLVPALVWAGLAVPSLLVGPGGGAGGLSVASQNLGGRADVAGIADSALVAVQELTGRSTLPHPHRAVVGTVGLFSRYPLADVRPLDLGQGWPRALRATVRLPLGDTTVYAVHLGSVRLGATASRDRTLAALTDLVRADRSPRLLVLGDLNTASTDPALDRLTEGLTQARDGAGFTWPSVFPLTRPDHILVRGFRVATAEVRAGGGSDHLAVRADLGQ